MSHAKNKVNWCTDKAKKELQEGKRHRGLLEIKPSSEKAQEHIAKAEHNLKATLYLYKGRYTDWCSSSLFYAIYHCFLSILAKFGYESRNQECTFAVIALLIEEGKINLRKEDLEKISLLGAPEVQESSDTAVSLREEYQYGTKVSLESGEYQELLQLAKDILDKTKEIMAQ